MCPWAAYKGVNRGLERDDGLRDRLECPTELMVWMPGRATDIPLKCEGAYWVC